MVMFSYPPFSGEMFLYPIVEAIEMIFCLTSLLIPVLLFNASETADGETLAFLAMSIIRGPMDNSIRFTARVGQGRNLKFFRKS
jgi:hypothetical protein